MSAHLGSAAPTGALSMTVVTREQKQADAEREARRWRLKNRLRMLRRGEFLVPLVARLAAKLPGVTTCYGTLSAVVVRRDGTRLDLGVVGHHLTTTAGKNYLASCFDNTAEPEVFKYHALGTGATAAAVGDTALQTECTTALNPDSTRAVGSQSHSGNTYTTVGTLTFDASVALTEWGLLSAASAGTLLDRQVFAVVNLGSGDSMQNTYVYTYN